MSWNLVASLVDKSLLRLDEAADEPRYRMLETIRAFGRGRSLPMAARLKLPGRRTPRTSWPWPSGRRRNGGAENRLCGWTGWRRSTTTCGQRSTGRSTRRQVELGYRLAIALHWFWRVRGPVSEGRRWMETLLAVSDEVSPRLQAALLARAGDFAMMQGDFPRAVELLDASIALAREIDDRETLTYALGWRGITTHYMGNYELSRQLLEQAVSLARAAAVPLWERPRADGPGERHPSAG